MLAKPVAVEASNALVLLVLPSPPPTIRTTIVFRQVGSLLMLMRRVTSVFASSSIALTGVSKVLKSSPPAGIKGAGRGFGAAPTPCQVPRMSTPTLFTTSLLDDAESALITTACAATWAPLLAATVGRVMFQRPVSDPESVGVS